MNTIMTPFPECVIVSKKQNDSATIDDDKEDKENKINIKIQTKESHSKEDFYVCKVGTSSNN